METKYLIGGSTGDFFRIASAKNNNEEIEKYFITQQSSAIEIMFHDSREYNCSISKDILQHNYAHCSIHAPVYNYQNDSKSHEILKYLDELCTTLPIQNIVIHPDKVIHRSIFNNYKHLPLSIENMDERKRSYQSVQEIGRTLEQYPYLNLTLDVQHVFVNDPSMKLAEEFHSAFGDKLVQYHVSGFDPEHLHYPLFKTKQTEIIHAIQRSDLPLIIESTFDDKDDLEKEIAYIKEYLR